MPCVECKSQRSFLLCPSLLLTQDVMKRTRSPHLRVLETAFWPLNCIGRKFYLPGASAFFRSSPITACQVLVTGRELEAGDVIGVDADADAAAVSLHLLVSVAA